MNAQNIPQPEDRTEEEQERLIKQLRDSIELSHHHMHTLLLNEDAFVDKITLFNNTAKEKISQKGQLEISQALVYLNQAQKILEYAAGCGKNINRQMIVCVLHNQACIYQILWELQQCSNYLQALIYNYETFFKQANEFSVPPSCINNGSQINFDTDKMFGFAGGSEISYVSKMKDPRLISRAELKLLVYYFEHCAVKSQCQQNRKALDSAKKGIKVLKNSFHEQKTKFVQEMTEQKTYLTQSAQKRYFLLQQLSEMAEKISLDKESIKSITKSAHFSLQIWSNNRSFYSDLHKEDDSLSRLKEKLKHLAIGTIMEIVPNAYDKLACEAVEDDPDESILSMEQFMLRVFFLSVGYFSVATELRILSNTLCKGKREEDRKNSHEFKESMVYHLIAIIIASLFIPYECRYIVDILASYFKHYSCNLEEYKPVEQESFDKIIELLGFKLKGENNTQKTNEKLAKTVQGHAREEQPQLNEYNMNCKQAPIVVKTKRLKKKSKEQLTFKQYSEELSTSTDPLKHSKTDLKSSQTKQSPAESKTSKSKTNHSKQTLNKDKIDKKYSELQKILSSQNLFILQQGPKTPVKKTKTDKHTQKAKEKDKEKSHTQISKDTIKVKKNIDKEKDDPKPKKGEAKLKTQRKTKNSQKKQQQKQQPKPNTVTEEDEQFFFYMTKKTTKTTNANGMFSPKDSIKSIGSSRKSANKKSSMYSSRSNSKNSPRVFAQSPRVFAQSSVATINSPVSKGSGGIKKIMSDKKSPTAKVSMSLYKNYF